MFAIIGIIVLLVMVFGGFALTGGNLGPVMHALPHEMLIIGGAGIGALIIGNSAKELKALGGGLAKVFKGPQYNKQDYLDCIFLVSKLMKMLRTDGPVAVEPHIENPAESALVQRISQIAEGPDADPSDLRHAAAGGGLVGHARSACGRGCHG